MRTSKRVPAPSTLTNRVTLGPDPSVFSCQLNLIAPRESITRRFVQRAVSYPPVAVARPRASRVRKHHGHSDFAIHPQRVIGDTYGGLGADTDKQTLA